jgi:hypothetical protein
VPAPPVHCAALQGQLFTQDFLLHGSRETSLYQALDDAAQRTDSALNEAQTENPVNERVLVEPGWVNDPLPQVSLSGKRRADVPDILLIADDQAMQAARAEARDDTRCRHGLAILEAKHWMHLYGLDEDGVAFGHCRTKADVPAQLHAISSGTLRAMANPQPHRSTYNF